MPTLADLAKAKLRRKIPELTSALDSRFEDHHAVHLRQLLDHIDWFDATIGGLDHLCGRSANHISATTAVVLCGLAGELAAAAVNGRQ